MFLIFRKSEIFVKLISERASSKACLVGFAFMVDHCIMVARNRQDHSQEHGPNDSQDQVQFGLDFLQDHSLSSSILFLK